MYKLTVITSLYLATLVYSASPLDTPPRPGTPRDFVLPPTTVFELENGLHATLVSFGSLPKVTVRMVVRAGNLNETEDEIWLADLTGDLMKEGTTSRCAEQITREAAEMGGKIRIAVGEDCTTIRGDALSEFGPDLVQLMADMIQNPLFPKSELTRLKKDLTRSVQIQKSQPDSLVHERLCAVMFGDHPYGRVFPTEEMLNAYEIEAVRSFYEANFGARRTHVYVVGRFDEKRMKAAICRSLGGWDAGKAPLVNVPNPAYRKAAHLIHRPDAVQSSIAVVVPVVDPSHEDYLVLSVTNALLGGAMASRITQNIREDKGYSYDAYSHVSARYRNAYWELTAVVATDVTGAALREICGEIRRLRSEPPPEEELDSIRNMVAGLFVLWNSSSAAIAAQLSFLDLHGLDESYLTSRVRNVRAVIPRDIQKAAQTYFQDDRMLIIVAGDREKIYDQLLPFGPIVVDQTACLQQE